MSYHNLRVEYRKYKPSDIVKEDMEFWYSPNEKYFDFEAGDTVDIPCVAFSFEALKEEDEWLEWEVRELWTYNQVEHWHDEFFTRSSGCYEVEMWFDLWQCWEGDWDSELSINTIKPYIDNREWSKNCMAGLFLVEDE